jgi:charged multivesicular body protein 4
MNLFGRKKKDGGGAPPVRRAGDADPSSAILRIRETVETLEKRDAHLAKKEKALLLEAKQLAAAKDKKRAMIALKKKKTYEKERSKISGMILSLEQQVSPFFACASSRCLFVL